MIERPTLIIMAKAPRVGLGKSRLARDIGRVEAWRINRALQAHTLCEARDARWRTILCVAPDSSVSLALPGVWPREIERTQQGKGDFGQRMARILAKYRNVAIIGTDCPALSGIHIARAFEAVKRAPFAIGPTPDGGFWLLAARSGRAAATAMTNVRWSSMHARADVLRNLNANVEMLAELGDIDSGADLAAYRSALRVSSG